LSDLLVPDWYTYEFKVIAEKEYSWDAMTSDWLISDSSLWYYSPQTFADPVVVTTVAATAITSASATLNATLEQGDYTVTSAGFMYKAASEANFTSVDVAIAANLSHALTGLTQGTTYQYKAFAVYINDTVSNTTDTVYGKVVSFVASTIAIEEAMTLENSISVYPNPVKDALTIKTNNNSLLSVELTDLNGRVIRQTTVNTLQYTMEVSTLASGIYLLKIHTDTGSVSKKIRKE
jgi:hypothetical protein